MIKIICYNYWFKAEKTSGLKAFFLLANRIEITEVGNKMVGKTLADEWFVI